MHFAVDVGATTTVAAMGSAEPAAVALSEEADGFPIPSAVTWRRDGSSTVGWAADLDLDVNPRAGVRGPIATMSSGAAISHLDQGPVPVVALVSALLQHARRSLEREAQAPMPAVTLTVPVGWSLNGRQARALRAAAALAAMPDNVLLVHAPLAAATHVCGVDALEQAIAICDIGGTTSQLAVVSCGRVIAARQMTVGTDTLDESLYVDVLRQLQELDDEAARELEAALMSPGGPEDPSSAEWRRCQTAIARSVRSAREQLSSTPEATVKVPSPVAAAVTITRDRLAGFVERDLGAVAGLAREMLARTGEEVGRLMIVGGGAHTPGLADLLSAQVEAAVETATEPDLITALGAVALGESAGADSGPQRRALHRISGVREIRDDVVAAAVSATGAVVVALATDSGRAVASLDQDGAASAQTELRGGPVRRIQAGDNHTLVVTEGLATIFDHALGALAARPDPLAAALGARSAWVIHRADADRAPSLVTYALSGGLAVVAAEERLDLSSSSRRSGLRTRRDGALHAAEVPSCAANVGSTGVVFAVASGTKRPAQLVGRAGRDGLQSQVRGEESTPWIQAIAVSGELELVLRCGGGGERSALARAALAAGTHELWGGDVSCARLVQSAAADWLLACQPGRRWEVFGVTGAGVSRLAGGDGTVGSVLADGGLLWLVIDDGEPALCLLRPDGTLITQQARTLPEQTSLVGRREDRLIALCGPPQRPRRLVSLVAPT